MIQKKRLTPDSSYFSFQDFMISGSLGVGLGKDCVKIEYLQIITNTFS